jgi:putative endopeptidase
MRKFLAASLLSLAGPLCLAQSPLPVSTSSAPTSAPKKPISMDLSGIDKTADPCVDFYAYACGNWRKNNPIPGDQTRWGRFNEVAERNNYLLYGELKAAADAPKTPLQTKYGNYFASCMNTELTEKLGAKPLEPELAAIAGLKNGKGFAALNVELAKRFGDAQLLDVGVEQDQKDSSLQILATDQGGLSLPDREYYLGTDDRSITLRSQYVAHVTKMFVLRRGR